LSWLPSDCATPKEYFNKHILPYKPDVYTNVKIIVKWARQFLEYRTGKECYSQIMGANRNKNGTHAQFRDEDTGTKYWCKFDRGNFSSFGRQFREHKNTVGETINKDIIDYLKDSDIIVIGKPNAIYMVSVKKIKENGRDRLNDADGGIQTISFPVKILERLDTLE